MNKRNKDKIGRTTAAGKGKDSYNSIWRYRCFWGNPSFYDNGYNMSSTFYNRPPTKKFGTVQENPKNMSRLLNSTKNKSGLVRTSIDCGNSNVNVKTQVLERVNETSKIFKDE